MNKETENIKTVPDEIKKTNIPTEKVSQPEKNTENNTKSAEDEISMSEFLEFLKLACQIHDIIFFGESKYFGDPDLNDIANNSMINKILGDTIKQRVNELSIIYDNQLSANTNNVSGQSNRIETAASILRKRALPSVAGTLKNCLNRGKLDAAVAGASSTSSSLYSKGIHPSLKKKLDQFIDEGIIDSILPHICPAHPPSALLHYTLNNSNARFKTVSKPKETSNVNSNNNSNSSKTGQHQQRNVLHASVDIVEVPSAQEGNESIMGKSENTEKHKAPKTADTVYKVKENKTTLRRKSLASGLGSRDSNENRKCGESEVIIHVCDEVKSTSKDFSCPQNLLVNKMRYFADVTGGQKLEDMDISVHCDIQIFEWLMKWVKKDINQSSLDGNSNSPQLDASNVIPILVSASFLQMEPLLLDCLSFCHSRLNDVVRTSTNLSCLNDAIIIRLAAMFTNLELEMVKDKKERVTPRLWTKLIQSLMEPEPQALRGHYFSLAGIFRCQKCGKYLTQAAATYVYCTASNIRINRWGQLVSQHIKDQQWDINHYIVTLYKELKSWRKVYWKLWGHCHFLYCCICETHFPVYQMNWCLFHPEPAQFLGPITEGHAPGPAGRFPCCGQQAFRFESLIGPNGCQFREHSVLVESDRDRAVLALAQIAAEGGCLTESPKMKTATQCGVAYEPIWTGISLMPTKCRQGLLPVVHVDESNSKFIRRGKTPISYPESSSESDSSDSFPMAKGKFSNRQLSGSTDGCESESSSERNYKNNRRRRTARGSKTYGRYWCGEVSARSNQDNQREYEEKVMKQIMSIVSRKNGNDHGSVNTGILHGGSYVRLESDWKEQLRQR
ncbi:SANT and BTB domain regulator of class switch recombination, partial [Condylostylus longicornis]|uniref:SANT and BTB domain regulator of class switch recombination n=1 Tax=Condylostylus longicornis TaxID=2530218 RepID=UPI00244DA2F7